MKETQLFGSALLITGTAIGAGMLGIPMACAQLGLVPASLLLVLIWFFSYLAALFMLEVTLNLQDSDNLHLNAMAKNTLGRGGQIVAWVCVIGLLYSLTVAYITGGESMLSTFLRTQAIQLSKPLLATLFTVILGLFILISTRATDLLNRTLMTIKAILIIAMVVMCVPVIDVTQLLATPSAKPVFWLSAAPVIFVSFGFHHIIPSLAQYNHNEVSTLKRAIFLGSVLPLIIYFLWLVLTLGVLPKQGPMSFASIQGQDVGQFILMLSMFIKKPILGMVVNLFANIAIITSFLGVTLGLFDFLRDSLNVGKTDVFPRIGIALLTFGLPLLAAIYYPMGFIKLLAYGGIFLAIMAFILPPIMAMQLRKRGQKEYYRVPGKTLPFLVIAFGLLITVLGLMY